MYLLNLIYYYVFSQVVSANKTTKCRKTPCTCRFSVNRLLKNTSKDELNDIYITIKSCSLYLLYISLNFSYIFLFKIRYQFYSIFPWILPAKLDASSVSSHSIWRIWKSQAAAQAPFIVIPYNLQPLPSLQSLSISVFSLPRLGYLQVKLLEPVSISLSFLSAA